MTSPSLSRSLWSDLIDLYAGADPASAKLRAAHLQAVVRLTPATMVANLCSVAVVLLTFSPAVPLGMWLWAAVLALTAVVGLVNWSAQRRRHRESASTRTMHHATAQAAWLAGVWGLMPLSWFPSADSGQQMVVATLITGMIGAGSFVLATVPIAAAAYVLVFSGSALVALHLAGNPAPGVAMLVGVYSPMVLAGSISAWAKATALLREKAHSAQQEQTLAILLQDYEQGSDESLWETGPDGRLRNAPPRLATMLGVNASEAQSLQLLDLLDRISPHDAPALRAAVRAERPFKQLQFEVSREDQPRHLLVNGKPLLDAAGNILGWRGVLADVTDKVLAQERLRQLAHTDSLTGLANRFSLRDTLGQPASQSHRAALIMLDLDHFKVVNDSLGHSAGDEVLCAVAEVLRRCVRPGDLVARLGGDEFAVVMMFDAPESERGNAPEASAMAGRLVEALSQPIVLRHRKLRIGASVGLTLCHGPRTDVDELLAQADTALYAAKAAGRGRFAIYEAALGEHSRRRLAIEQGLRNAQNLGQLSLHWQPKVDIAAWRVVGAEALMRWSHPDLGNVSPAEFIAVAEQCGLIEELGRWALRQACAAAAGPLRGLTISVNVSPLQLRDGLFVAQVREALRESGLPPANLELEITESVFIDDAFGALDRLYALHGLGVRIALDDFGTGYSSLAYLRRFPFDTLKIDRTFVSEVASKADARAIVEMISRLAATLGMRTVCEGVETALQLQAVAGAGCHEVQGYFVSAARPLGEFKRAWRGWERESPLLEQLH
jgi:diguanylate cyclase (GGDEF)-like protein/PAS domain S-box-containing protein